MRITKEYVLDGNRTTEPASPEEILTAPTQVVYNETVQIVIPKNMVSNPRWFDGDQMKFKDWWRGIQLFLKSNRAIAVNNKITAVLA